MLPALLKSVLSPDALLHRTVNLAVTGDADPDTAWERYARPALWSTWAPQIRSVECSVDEIAEGATGIVHGPAPVTARFTVTEVRTELRSWSWTVRVGPEPLALGLHLAHQVLDDPAGCRTTLAVTGPAPVVLLYAPVARFALSRLVRG